MVSKVKKTHRKKLYCWKRLYFFTWKIKPLKDWQKLTVENKTEERRNETKDAKIKIIDEKTTIIN